MKRILIVALVFLSKFSFADTPLILLSIDGFANQYLNQYKPKNMLLLANSGVLANALKPVFPSKTFPNHLSIITGRYPAQHGIVHNRFYHRDLNKNYYLGAAQDQSLWLTATPLWALAEKNNITSAIYFWPESHADINGISATYKMPYIHDTPNKQRFDKILTWLKLPEKERPGFIMGYFSTIDSAGHSYGPDSMQVKKAISEFDQLLGIFLSEVDQPINIVLVSDHGMTAVNNEVIKWRDYINENKKLVVSNGQTQLYIYATDPKALNDARSQLSNMPKNNKKFLLYEQGDFPKHWQFSNNSPAIPDLILNAIPPYIFENKKTYTTKATHGYDPQLTTDLDAIFIASGPAFKNKVQVKSFENIHIFPLLAKILNIPEHELIDGKLEVLLPILK
ncbi:MAG: putative AlkP superfamily pyrophosphatase or phosphodiesterase [Alteromonadaceae bacterium]|jgi:predicted AlkP superfamily pyrophosphatase or phosphodiesterase